MGFPDASLTHDGDGAPRLSCGMGISVSDTKNYWCCALTEGAVGLDIEENRNVKAVMVKRLHPLEQQYLSGLEPEGREWTEEFLTIWTRKESYMKFCESLMMKM